VLWVLAAAGAALTPALVHGASLGSFDVLSKYGLTRQAGVVVHNRIASDQIDQTIPWTALAWMQVHQGHLPLWNPFSALGTPLAFNWQSGAFSVPALVGYVFPLRLAYTAQLVVTLVVAGTGAYVLGRLLHLGVLASAFAGTAFELSGPLFGWLGWPVASVVSWAGWIFAGAILIVRGQHRARSIAWFALAFAFAVYAGQPHVLVVLVLALVVFLVVQLGLRTTRFDSGPIYRPVVDLAVAGVAGLALAAPLALPGFQLSTKSVRQLKHPTPLARQVLPFHDVTHLLFQSFDGLTVAGSHWFGDWTFYLESAAYVGVITLVMAVMAVAVGRRRPEVLAFAAVALVTLVVAFFSPLASLLDHLPHTKGVLWRRALVPLAFALCVLAGYGIDLVVRSPRRRAVGSWAGGGFAAVGLVLVALWVAGRGHLSASDASIRAKSFIWPAVETALGIVVIAGLGLARRRTGFRGPRTSPKAGAGRWAGAALLAGETVFLVAAAGPLLSSSPTFFPATPGVEALVHDVGTSEVGLGAADCSHASFKLGILPDANVGYGVKELAFYDPLAPANYFSSWKKVTGHSAGTPHSSFYCPQVMNRRVARLYGVAFVLWPHGTPGPTGGIFDATVGGEDLYRMPGASAATLTPAPAHGPLPGIHAPGRSVAVTYPDAESWKVVTNTTSPQVLRLRLANAPGWYATIDGRSLPLSTYAGIMLQARIPRGRHTVVLHYWPTDFTVGIVLAICSAVGLLVALFTERMRRSPSIK